MVNPCRPNNQLVGVYGLDILRLYKSVFETSKGFKYSIVHSLDGYDEISLTGDSKVVSNNNELLIKPKDFDSSKKYPLHLFLHGVGERGNDNEKQLIHGSKVFLKHPTECKFFSLYRSPFPLTPFNSFIFGYFFNRKSTLFQPGILTFLSSKRVIP